MATKTELLAALDVVTKSLVTLSSVANALTEGSPVVVPSSELSITALANGKLRITSDTTITAVQATYVEGRDPWKWYGSTMNLTLPVEITPSYTSNGDFIKVWYSKGGGNVYIDGPKAVGVKPPVTPTTPAQPANGGPKAFVRNLTFGPNIERLHGLSLNYQGTPLTKDPYYRYLASKGCSHVRMFVPYRADADMGIGTGVPDVASYDALLDCVQAANMGGLSVFLGATDVVGEGVIKYEEWKQHVDRLTKRIAERGFDPSKVAIECANELAGNDNTFWNPMRNGIHAVIRNNLPNHIIVHGGAGWNGIMGWDDKWQVPPDLNIILQFHAYNTYNLAQWTWVREALGGFAAKLGVPMVSGEIGADINKGDPSNMDEWTTNYKTFADGAGALRLTPWTVTKMGGFRMNRSETDATLHPKIEAALPDLLTRMRVSPGFAV